MVYKEQKKRLNINLDDFRQIIFHMLEKGYIREQLDMEHRKTRLLIPEASHNKVARIIKGEEKVYVKLYD